MTYDVAVLPKPRLLIGNEQLEEASGGAFEHRYPPTGEVQSVIPLGGAAEIDHALDVARAAAPEWRRIAPDTRRGLLRRLADLIRADQERLGDIVTHEIGSLRKGTARNALLAADWFDYYAGWVDKAHGEVVPLGVGVLDYVVEEPFGVVGVIVPWNGPLVAIGMKVAPALAAGNTIVLKPPEQAPFTSIRFAELVAEAGFPSGVVNVVPGGPEAGAALCSSTKVDKISFTGGGATATKVLEATARSLRPVVLELGGKSAALVFSDANIERAVQLSVAGCLITLSGQGCMLPTRLLVHNDIYDQVATMVSKAALALVTGDPFDNGSHLGPLVSASHRSNVHRAVTDAISDGAGELLAGGEEPDPSRPGYFYRPTVFGDVDTSSKLAQQEIFGPVLAISRFSDEAEAVSLANATDYGLAAYLHTNDLGRAHRVADALDAGSVAVNGFPVVPAGVPFGGVKSSGFGREGGRWGLSEFLRLKNVHLTLS
jgi:acyl-CoA reductase-like NAD-dependent aldehyde dehydrogenase